MESGKMFLQLKGRVELSPVLAYYSAKEGGKDGSANGNTNLVEGNQGWPGSHIGGLGARVDAALRVRIDGRLLNDGSLTIRSHCW